MDCVFALDEFGATKKYTGGQEKAMQIVMLISIYKGTNSYHPDQGVGLYSRYLPITEDNIDDLQADIDEQMETYLPEYVGIDVTAFIDDDMDKLVINIDIEDDDIYSFDTESKKLFSGYKGGQFNG